MAQGHFNVAEFIRRMGLKNVKDMPVIEAVQPTVIVGELAGLAPSLVPPRALYGGAVTGGAGFFPYNAILSLAPGGTWVDYGEFVGPGNDPLWGVLPIASVTGGTGSFPPNTLSNETPLAVVRFGVNGAQLLTTGGGAAVLPTGIAGKSSVNGLPVFVPRGQALVFEGGANITMKSSWIVRDVPASEGEPS